MFEEIFFMIGFWAFSGVISYLLLNKTPSPINKVVQFLAIIGIIIHELCHLCMCIITNTPIKEITLIGREKLEDQKVTYYGKIELDGKKTVSFMQSIVIGFAPLYLSFWLFFFLWELIINPEIEMCLFFIYLFVMVSIVLAAAPSMADLSQIPLSFRSDIRYSLYQIFLVILSILLLFFIVLWYEISFFHEIFYYVLKYFD